METVFNQNTGKQTFIAKTISGLESVLANELVSLGATDIEVLTRAISFQGDKELLYRANYCLRTALRILVPVFSFQMVDEDDLYSHINGFAWENLLNLQQTLAVDAVVTDSELTHSHYVALRTKDAIVDRFRTLNNGRRPSVDTENPHLRINIHIKGNICDVSVDSSGASLHKRGYRVSNAEAPLSEVLAAGMILLSGWKCDSDFIDPMCGSGTLLIEAAMIANNFPAGMYRNEFGFMHWPDFDATMWENVKQQVLDTQREFEHQILGFDISAKNLASAKANVKSARLHKDIKLAVSPFAALQAPHSKPGVIVINPPYGERIRLNDIIGLYKSIGNTLKQEFAGYQAWVISSDQKALTFIGLKPSEKLTVFNGPLECRFVHYDLYRGSRKGKYLNPKETSADDTLGGNKQFKPQTWKSKEAPEHNISYRSEEENDNFGSRRKNKPAFDKDRNQAFRKEEKFLRPEKSERFEKKSDLNRKTKPTFNDGGPEKKYFDKRERENNKTFNNPDSATSRTRPFNKPPTRIENRDDYLPKSEIVASQANQFADNDENKTTRQPSKGNKFTEKRDKKLMRNKPQRPRKTDPNHGTTTEKANNHQNQNNSDTALDD